MELRFGFVLKTVLTMPGCFQWCWAVLSQCQGISAPDPSLPEEEGRMPQGTAGDTSRTADPNWAKRYPTPYGVLLNIYEAGEQGGRGGSFGMTTFVFPSHHLVWQSPTFLEIAEHLPALKRWINSLFSFACGCSFCFTYWTAFISTQELSQFSLSDSLPFPDRGLRRQLCGAWLPAGVKTWHTDTTEIISSLYLLTGNHLQTNISITKTNFALKFSKPL